MTVDIVEAWFWSKLAQAHCEWGCYWVVRYALVHHLTVSYDILLCPSEVFLRPLAVLLEGVGKWGMMCPVTWHNSGHCL